MKTRKRPTASVDGLRVQLETLVTCKFGRLFEKLALGVTLTPAEFMEYQQSEHYRGQLSLSWRLKTERDQRQCLSEALKLFKDRYGKETA